MTVTINGYEVEIKAKGETAERFNKADTMSVLNLLSIYAAEASNRYESLGSCALQRIAKEAHKNIFEKLDSMGYYN